MPASAIRSRPISAARKVPSSTPRSERPMRSNGLPRAVRDSFRCTRYGTTASRLTAVGGEDSISNLQMSKLVGSQRTYVFTGGRGLDMHAWLDGMRAGRAFVTNGPLVELSVNGALPGETVGVPASGPVDVQVAGTVDCPTAERHALFQRQSGGGDFVERRSQDRRLSEDRAGPQERVVSCPCRRRSCRPISSGYELSTGIHKPRLGARR